MQARSSSHLMLNRIYVCQLGVSSFAQLAARLCRQAQVRDDEAGAWTWVSSIPFLSQTSSLHGTAWSTPSRFLSSCHFRLYIPLSLHQPSALKRTTGSPTAMLSESEVDEYNSSRMAIFSCGTRPTLTGGMSTGRIAGTSLFRAWSPPPAAGQDR
jgi:hypothetical protein